MKKNMDGRRMVPYNVYRMTLHCAMTLHNARLGRGVCGAAGAASLSAGWWQLHDVRHETAAKCTAAAEWRGLY